MMSRFPFRVVALAIVTVLAVQYDLAQTVPSTPATAAAAGTTVPFSEYGEGMQRIPTFCVPKDTLLREPHTILGRFPHQSVSAADAIEVTLQELGTMGLRRIAELQYRHSFREAPGTVSVLHAVYVSDSADRYCLLLASERSTAETWFIEDKKPAARIVQAGEVPVLEFTLAEGGMARLREEHYFLLEAGELVEVRFADELNRSWKAFAPEGSRPRRGSTFCLADLQLRTGLWRGEDPGCCPGAGVLFVQYRLNGKRLEVMEQQLYETYDEMLEARGPWSCQY